MALGSIRDVDDAQICFGAVVVLHRTRERENQLAAQTQGDRAPVGCGQGLFRASRRGRNSRPVGAQARGEGLHRLGAVGAAPLRSRRVEIEPDKHRVVVGGTELVRP